MLATFATETRFGLAEADPSPAVTRLDALRAAPGDRRAWHDRPAVWRCLSGLPAAQMLWDKVLAWRLDLHSCRIALALRLYRDEHGAWPARLEDLVPGQLPNPLPIPIQAQLTDYRVQDHEWGLWRKKAEGKDGELGDLRLPNLARQWSGFVDRIVPPTAFVKTAWIHSGEAAQHRLTWEGLVVANHIQPDGTIDPDLLRRYGLPTPESTPSLVTRLASLAQALADPRPAPPQVPPDGLATPASEWGSGPGPGPGGPGRYGFGPPPGGRRRDATLPGPATSRTGATNLTATGSNAPISASTPPVQVPPPAPRPRPPE
jgi:hypothetical protein